MKRSVQRLSCLLFLLLVPLSVLPAQEEPSRLWLWFGPRIGMTGVTSAVSKFDAVVQHFFPSDREYFPLYSEIGVAVEQRIPIADTRYELFLQQRIMAGGLDQNVVLPSVSLLLGVRAPFGLIVKLGPDFGLESRGKGATFAPALMYAVGWCFVPARGINIPVVLSTVPIPREGGARLSLSAGLDFGFSPKCEKREKREKKEKKRAPFNY